MQYSIEYIYRIIDEFTEPLAKLKSQLRGVTDAIDQINTSSFGGFSDNTDRVSGKIRTMSSDIDNLVPAIDRVKRSESGMFSTFNEKLENGIRSTEQFRRRFVNFASVLGGMGTEQFAESAISGYVDYQQQIQAAAGTTVLQQSSGLNAAQQAALLDKTTAEYSQASISVGMGTIFKPQEIADTLSTLSKSGFDTATIIGDASNNFQNGMSKSVITLAETIPGSTKQALDVAKETVVDALHAYSLSNPGEDIKANAAFVSNDIAKAAVSGSENVSDISKMLRSLGGEANIDLGGSQTQKLNEALVLSLAMAQQGLRGSRAGTDLKTMLETLGVKGQQLAAYGINTKSFEDSSGHITDIMGLIDQIRDKMTSSQQSKFFGQRGLFALQHIELVDPSYIAKFEGALQDTNGAAQTLADTMLSGNVGAMKRLESSFAFTKIAMGGFMADALLPLVDALNRFFGWLEGSGKAWLPLITGIFGAVTAIFAVMIPLGIFMSMLTGIGSIIELVGKAFLFMADTEKVVAAVTKVLTVVQTLLDAVMAPESLIFIGIMLAVFGLIRGFEYLYDNVAGFRNFVNTALKDSLQWLHDMLQAITSLLTGIEKFTGGVVSSVVKFVQAEQTGTPTTNNTTTQTPEVHGRGGLLPSEMRNNTTSKQKPISIKIALAHTNNITLDHVQSNGTVSTSFRLFP